MAEAAQERKAQHEGMEAIYVCASAQLSWGQRTLSKAKLFQNRPQFPFSNRFTSFQGGAFEATTFISWAAVVCHVHGLKEIKFKWEREDKFS